MIQHVIMADVIKSKRTVLFLTLFLAPGLTLIYECANFLLRSQVLFNQAQDKHTDLWHIFLYDKQFILSLTIPLSITLAASIIANTEHQANAWKQILALPLKRGSIFLGKFGLLFLLSFMSGVFTYVSYIIFGLSFRLGETVPWLRLIGDSMLPFLCSIPIMVFQLYLSIRVKNQAFSILVGALSSMAGLFLALSPITQWLPWAYPLNSSTLRLKYSSQQLINNPDLIYVLISSVILGGILLVIAAFLFSKNREV